MFKYFLISSSRYEEQNSLSEAFWILKTIYNINVLRAINLPIHGLGMLESNTLHSLTIKNIDILSLLKEPIHYCRKIVPLEFYAKYSEQNLLNWINIAKLRLKQDQSWRITIKKRQSQIKSNHLITIIAQEIDIGEVDLNNPDKIFQVEILGSHYAACLLSQNQILNFSNTMTTKK